MVKMETDGYTVIEKILRQMPVAIGLMVIVLIITPVSASASDIVINEIMFIPTSGDNEWIELYNSGTSSVNIDNYDITDKDDNTYTISSALPDLPPDNYVVIIYDGIGSGFDDYDFSDGKAILHTPAGLSGEVFEDVTDTCILYTGSTHDETTKIDFVAWGDYPEYDRYINTLPGRGSQRMLGHGKTIGLHPKMYGSMFSSWVVYQSNENTPGSANPIPSPILCTPWEYAIFADETTSFAWNEPEFNIKNYRLQVDDSPSFASPIIDVQPTVSPYISPTALPDGTYYWRVKAIDKTGDESVWSNVVSFAIETGFSATKDLGITPILKRKDTKLLCLECAHDTDPDSWDNASQHISMHSINYCYACAIKMMASNYKGTLSMDRIAYQIGHTEGPPGPEWDLRHGRRASDPQIEAGLSWALNGAGVTYDGIGAFAKPTFAQVKAWIDADKPVILGVPGHVVVIDGYTEPDIVHYNDPDTGTETKPKWATVPGDAYWVLTPANAAARSDEPSVNQDPDNDGFPRFRGMWEGKKYNSWGIMTFDEERRFKTNPEDADSDNDCIQDKVEVWSYVFGKGKVNRVPDKDGDDKRAELDPDTDRNKNDGAVDGAEDKNRDGNLDPGETDPFDESDDNKAPGQETKDFGDAPDPTYPSRLASNGARHSVFAFEWLGEDANGELDSKQVDKDEHDDGVTFVGTPQLGSPFRVIVTVTTSGMGAPRYRADDKLYLNAWIDWNANGVWESFEKIIEWNGGPGLNDVCTKGKLLNPATPWPVGTNGRNLKFDVTVPVTTIPYYMLEKPYYSRFRLDYDENLSQVKGVAQFGEVEDYEHKPPITEDIPTLTPIGCILTILLLSGLGAIRIRKMRK